MSGTWKRDEFKEGGLRGVQSFNGRLREVMEDVEGKHNVQLAIYFYDVELLDAPEEATLTDNEFLTWIKQSSNKNSINEKMLNGWADFCEANDLDEDDLPGVLYDKMIQWDKETFDFGGEGMSPGTCFIPVKLVEEAPRRRGARKGSDEPDQATPAKGRKARPTPESKEVPDSLMDLVITALGEDGGTLETLNKTLKKKAATRTAITDAGGLPAVLQAMQERDLIFEDDGYFYAEGPADEIDDLPF